MRKEPVAADRDLDAVFGGPHTGLGPEWSNTVMVVATEFGRTTRVNGTGRADHAPPRSRLSSRGR